MGSEFSPILRRKTRRLMKELLGDIQAEYRISCSVQMRSCRILNIQTSLINPDIICRLPEKYLQGVKDKSTESSGQENASANNGVHQESDSSGSSPLLVFINAGSGGRVGEQLSRYFQKALRPSQVWHSMLNYMRCCKIGHDL